MVDDIILSKVGNSIGYFARVDENIGICNISENNIGIKLHDNYNEITKHYILTYLNTQIAQKLVIRRQSGNAQPKLNVGDLAYIPIPIMADSMMCGISKLIKKSVQYAQNAIDAYNNCKCSLLKLLDINSFIPSHTVGYQSSFSILKKSRRWDAEYYQPKYEDFRQKIEGYTGGYNITRDICSIIDDNYIPQNDVIYRYIELANIGNYGDITGYTRCEGRDLPTRARRLVRSGDVIVSSIEGSLQSCAIVPNELDGALCSNGFYVIRSAIFTPEVLLALFKSIPLQMLMKRGCTGTILSAIGKNEFEKIPIPIIPDDIQIQISQQVQESFKLRSESKRLLEVAKKAVEIAIEENEENALKYINEYGKSLYDK